MLAPMLMLAPVLMLATLAPCPRSLLVPMLLLLLLSTTFPAYCADQSATGLVNVCNVCYPDRCWPKLPCALLRGPLPLQLLVQRAVTATGKIMQIAYHQNLA